MQTVYVWLLKYLQTYLTQKPDILYPVAFAPTVTGSVLMRKFRLFLGQCGTWGAPPPPLYSQCKILSNMTFFNSFWLRQKVQQKSLQNINLLITMPTTEED